MIFGVKRAEMLEISCLQLSVGCLTEKYWARCHQLEAEPPNARSQPETGNEHWVGLHKPSLACAG